VRQRRRIRGLIAIALYGAVVLALPSLHAGIHAQGILHTHGPTPHPHAHAVVGGALHSDLEAIGLHDLVESGGTRVDCSFASFTQVSGCDADDRGASTFAAEALARTDATPTPEPFDPEHGRGSLEHLGLAFVGVAPLVAPARFDSPTRLVAFVVDTNPFACVARRPSARAPPALSPTNS
jgi:hypothetical protein